MRKNPTSLSILLFAISFSVISSCKKDDAPASPKTNCQLAKAYYYNETGIAIDSLIYTYTNGKLTKASNAEAYFTLEYMNDKVTKRNYYETGSTDLEEYHVATYNADGSLSTIKKYYKSGALTIQYSQYDLTYANGKMVKFDVKEYDYSSSQLELRESSTYTYTGNNITQSVNTSAVDVITYKYNYDNNENYLAKNNALFTDYGFFEEIDGSIFPLLISANNTTNVFDDSDEFPISYKLDSKNNFHELHFDGKLASRYFYECK